MNQFSPAYLDAAMQNERDKVAAAAPSTRNHTLNKAAFNLARLGIPGREIIHSLHSAALRCGLKNGEIYSTINSGMRAGNQHPRSAANGFTRRNGKGAAVRTFESYRVKIVEPHPDAVTIGVLPNCDAPDKFRIAGDDGPHKLDGELRRHVHRHSGRPVRLKIKLKRDGEIGFQNWYAVMHDGVSGWQAQKPAKYVAVPYVGSLDPFDSELVGDALIWPEGEKDVDTLTRLGVPAFTFGGTGDGVLAEASSYLNSRRVVILADNDDGGRTHAEKKATLANEAGAASVRVVHFQELPPKADVSDFIETGGTLEQLYARIDAAPEWMPPLNSEQAARGQDDGSPTGWSLIVRRASEITPEPIEWLWPNRVAIGKQTMIVGEPGLGKSHKDPGGLAFRIGQQLLPGDIIGSSIFWDNERVSCTADQILAANENASDRPAQTEAEDFLREILRDGPRPAKDIESEAKEAGISWRTVNRAKKALGIVAERKAESGDGFGGSGRWYWSLPGPIPPLRMPRIPMSARFKTWQP